MPLDADHLAAAGSRRNRFHQPIVGHRLDHEPAAQSFGALEMDRIDVETRGFGVPHAKLATRLQGYRMAVAEQARVITWPFALMVDARGQTAGEGAAEQHVDLLHAAADAVDRPAALDHPVGEQQRNGVAVTIKRRGIALSSVSLRRDVRARSGQQQAVEPRGDRINIRPVDHRWHQHDDRAGQHLQWADEPGRHGLDRAIEHLVAAQDADERPNSA